jgi:purine-nucleoside phosphorylase
LRYIIPERIIKNRLQDEQLPIFDAAILIFRDKYTSSLLKYVLETKPFEKKLIYGISSEHTHLKIYKNKKILVLEQLIWGGPQTAIILEELSFLNIPLFLGIGACGSIANKISKGTIVINDVAVSTDGTSKYYSKADEIEINKDLKEKLLNFAKENKIHFVKSATIDALYQETEELVNDYKKQGIEIINMESSPFYSVAKYYKKDFIWIGAVTDSINNGEWNGWFDSKETTINSGIKLNELLNILL